MKTEDQVVSLALAKKMKELGFPQESSFYWVITSTTNYHLSFVDYYKELLPKDRNDYYSAYTVAELGEMLPGEIKTGAFGSGHTDWMIQSIWTDYEYSITYKCMQCPEEIEAFEDKSEANVRAKMLIYLKENGLLDP